MFFSLVCGAKRNLLGFSFETKMKLSQLIQDIKKCINQVL